MCGPKISERFKPHPNLKKVYYTYLSIVITPLITALTLVVWVVYTSIPGVWLYTLIPLIIVLIVAGFLVYWIRRYYDSIHFLLDKDEVVVERGVWWRMKHTVPYSRIMSVDVIQGPISRFYGVGSVHIYTAGYTGPAGGSAGPGARGAEAVIWGVQNFNEVREAVLSMVRGRPLFATAAALNVSHEILEELRSIRRILEKEASRN